jgi:hypothetical protein
MKSLQILVALVFIVGAMVMMVGAKRSRKKMQNVGWIMVAVSGAYLAWWYLFGH